jgi:flagellar basal body P-ring formation protein FlgA
MHRTALAFLLLLATPAAAQTSLDTTGSLGPAAPQLKRSITVTGDIVRIGDLIENAGPAAQIAIFRAPDLGTTGTVPTAQVLQAVRAHALLGVDTGGTSEVIVTRASRTITSKDVETRIAEAIAQRVSISADSEITARLDREFRTLQVEAGATGPLQISRMTYDPRTGFFDATLDLPGSAVARQARLRFTGTAVETVEIPMLARPLARGDILRPDDITMERRPKGEASADPADNPQKMAGLAARRALRAGQTLRTADLMRPELVQRNDNVTLLFEAPGIMLTSRAKALEAGAEGDLISVLNPQSKRTVQGVITAPGTVTVAVTKPRVAAIAPATPESRTE